MIRLRLHNIYLGFKVRKCTSRQLHSAKTQISLQIQQFDQSLQGTINSQEFKVSSGGYWRLIRVHRYAVWSDSLPWPTCPLVHYLPLWLIFIPVQSVALSQIFLSHHEKEKSSNKPVTLVSMTTPHYMVQSHQTVWPWLITRSLISMSLPLLLLSLHYLRMLKSSYQSKYTVYGKYPKI